MGTKARLIFTMLILMVLMAAGIVAWISFSQQATEEPDEVSSAPVSESLTPESSANIHTSSEYGDFASASGTNLNIRASWSAEYAGEGNIKLTVKVCLYSYALNIEERSGTITINGEDYSFTSPPISYNGDRLKETVLCEKTVDLYIPEGTDAAIPVSVNWHYGGSYDGTDIPDLSAEGSIALSAALLSDINTSGAGE